MLPAHGRASAGIESMSAEPANGRCVLVRPPLAPSGPRPLGVFERSVPPAKQVSSVATLYASELASRLCEQTGPTPSMTVPAAATSPTTEEPEDGIESGNGEGPNV